MPRGGRALGQRFNSNVKLIRHSSIPSVDRMLSRPASQFSIPPFPLKIFHASAPCSSCRCCCRCCRRRLSNIYTRSPSLGRRKISGIPSHTQVSRILECTLHTQMIREIIKHFSSTEEGISHFTITSLSLSRVGQSHSSALHVGDTSVSPSDIIIIISVISTAKEARKCGACKDVVRALRSLCHIE